jgi:hypothetical protein
VDTTVSGRTTVPLPLIGLLFDYHFTPQWSVGLRGEIFVLNIDSDTFGFSGRFINSRLSTEYWFFNNVGLGAGVNGFWFDIDVDTEDWRGALDYQYFGAQVYLTLRF